MSIDVNVSVHKQILHIYLDDESLEKTYITIHIRTTRDHNTKIIKYI